MVPISSRSPDGIRALLGRAALLAGAGLRFGRGWSGFSSLSSSGGDWEEAPPDPVVAEMVRFGERRQALAEQIAMELLQRPDLREAPEVIQDFVLQFWPLVLAQARLTCATPCEDPGTHLDTVTRLLWSVRRDAALRRPARLLELIPGLLQQLQQGMLMLGREPREFEGFFRALEILHLPALQLCARRRRGELVRPTLPAAPPRPSTSQIIAALEPGAWIDLYCGTTWRRARLDWVDPQRRQFMFSGHDGQSHAMTHRILARLLRERLVRLPMPARLTDAAQPCSFY